MHINLPFIPLRSTKPRTQGLTMVMDKGLSLQEAESLCETAGDLIDYVKLGFGTSLFTQNLKKKIAVYKQHNINVYLGGTLFEACLLRGVESAFYGFMEELGVDTIEISDGSIKIDPIEKCRLIGEMSKRYTVLSEVGSKQAGTVIEPEQWVNMMTRELEAGAAQVIAEARESGTVGIFDSKGNTNRGLIDLISDTVPLDRIIWEAPLKSQQAWFIRHFGAEVNLGNIPSNEVIALETLRTGLRGDTFGQFLPHHLREHIQE